MWFPWPCETATQLQSQSLPHLHPQMDPSANLRTAAASDDTGDVGMSSPWTAPRQKFSRCHRSSTADCVFWQSIESRSIAWWLAEPLISRPQLPWNHDGLKSRLSKIHRRMPLMLAGGWGHPTLGYYALLQRVGSKVLNFTLGPSQSPGTCPIVDSLIRTDKSWSTIPREDNCNLNGKFNWREKTCEEPQLPGNLGWSYINHALNRIMIVYYTLIIHWSYIIHCHPTMPYMPYILPWYPPLLPPSFPIPERSPTKSDSSAAHRISRKRWALPVATSGWETWPVGPGMAGMQGLLTHLKGTIYIHFLELPYIFVGTYHIGQWPQKAYLFWLCKGICIYIILYVYIYPHVYGLEISIWGLRKIGEPLNVMLEPMVLRCFGVPSFDGTSHIID